MTTSMHRLQISLPQWQVQFLADRARRDGMSIAELIRQMIQRVAEAAPAPAVADSLWEIAGLAEDHAPLLPGTPVSERPDLYLAALALPAASLKGRRTTRRPRRKSQNR